MSAPGGRPQGGPAVDVGLVRIGAGLQEDLKKPSDDRVRRSGARKHAYLDHLGLPQPGGDVEGRLPVQVVHVEERFRARFARGGGQGYLGTMKQSRKLKVGSTMQIS